MSTELVGYVRANISDFKAKMQQVQSQTKKVGQQMKDMGKSFSKYVTLPLLAAGGAAIKASMDFEASGAKYNTVFKGMTKESDKFIKEFRKLTPATQSEARNMASGIQDLLVPMGFMREEATKITGELMHVAGALANFNSGTHTSQDVINAMQSALSGMYRPLKSLGVQLDETTVKQKALEYGLVSAGQEVSKQVKVQVMLKEIYAQSGDALAAYTKENLDAKTSAGLLRGELNDLGIMFGDMLLPYVNKLITWIRDLVARFKELDDRTKKIIAIVAGLAAAIGPLLVILGFLITSIIPAIVAGGALIASAWAPITLLVLGVAAAFALLNKNMKANSEEVDKLVSDNSIEELNKKFEKSDKLLAKLRMQRFRDPRDREPVPAGDGTEYMVEDDDRLDKLIKQEEQRLMNLEAALKARKKADEDAITAAEEAKRQQKEIQKSLEQQLKIKKEELGVYGQLLAKMQELNAMRPMMNTAEEMAELEGKIADVQSKIDAFHNTTKEINRELSDIPKKIEPIGAAISKLGLDTSLPNLAEQIDSFIEVGMGYAIMLTEQFDRFGHKIKETKTAILDLTYIIQDAMIDSLEFLGEAFGNVIGEMVTNSKSFGEALKESFDFKGDFGKNFIAMLASWAQKVGILLLSAGLAIEAFKVSLKSLNGVGLIIAGGALIIAAAAAKAAISTPPAMSGGGGAGGGYSGGGEERPDLFGLRELGEFNVNVSGVITAQGSELVTVINNENERENF